MRRSPISGTNLNLVSVALITHKNVDDGDDKLDQQNNDQRNSASAPAGWFERYKIEKSTFVT